MLRRRAVPRAGRGVVGTVAQTAVIAGTATVVSNKVNHSMNANAQAQQQAQAAKAQQAADMQEMQQQLAVLQAQQAQAPVAPAAAPVAAPEPAAPAGGGNDLIAQLQQLADLKAAGVLSDAEFETAKARLLNG